MPHALPCWLIWTAREYLAKLNNFMNKILHSDRESKTNKVSALIDTQLPKGLSFEIMGCKRFRSCRQLKTTTLGNNCPKLQCRYKIKLNLMLGRHFSTCHCRGMDWCASKKWTFHILLHHTVKCIRIRDDPQHRSFSCNVFAHVQCPLTCLWSS